MPKPIKLMTPLTVDQMVARAKRAHTHLSMATTMASTSREEIGGPIGEEHVDMAIEFAIQGLSELGKIKTSLGFIRRTKAPKDESDLRIALEKVQILLHPNATHCHRIIGEALSKAKGGV